MGTSIVRATLSDGTELFGVLIVEGDRQLRVTAIDEEDAHRIQAAFLYEGARESDTPKDAA